MQHSPNVGVHQDLSKGEKLALVLQHYGLIDQMEVYDLFKIICPLHEDVYASMQIDLSRGTYYCYGCGAHGEAPELVRGIEGVNALMAYILLERITRGILASKPIVIRESTRESSKELLKQAKLYFYSLQKPTWSEIKNSYMHRRGYDSKTLELADVRINSNSNYGIAMPMKEMGRFKGYVLRATSEAANQNRKYLYSKGFSRRDTLVGDYNHNFVIVCEGYMDWLRFLQFGKSNAVAILGWKITEQQVAKLKQYTTRIISALDNTPTGRRGTEYLGEKGFEVVRFKFPPNIKDPGDLDQFDFNKAWSNTMREIKKRKDYQKWQREQKA